MTDLTPNQEMAARKRAKGDTYQQIVDAGHYSTDANACTGIKGNQKVAARVAELMDEGLKTSQLSPELLIAQLWDIVSDKNMPPGARVRGIELMGKTKWGGEMFTDKLKIETDDPFASIPVAVELLDAFMKDLIRLSPTSLSSPLKTTGKPLDSWSEDDLKLFIYTHYGLEPPKSLITLDI